MKNTTINRTEYPLIDIFKFIGAILVVSIHTGPFISINPFFHNLTNNVVARIAVPIYFVSNGYFLFKTTNFDDFNYTKLLNFVKKIFFLYLIWTLIYSPFIIRKILLQKSIIPFLRNVIFGGTYDHLWYLGATIVGTLLISVFIFFKADFKFTFCCAVILYLLGVFLDTNAPISRYIVENFQITARNGFFFAFPFILLGSILAYKKPHIKNRFSVIGLFLSVIFLLLEAFLTHYLHFRNDYNLYIFLIPITFFIFYLGLDIKIKPRKIYKKLRTTSILIYFVHPIFIFIFGGIHNSLIKFFAVLFFSILFSITVCYIQKFKYFRFLSKLYS